MLSIYNMYDEYSEFLSTQRIVAESRAEGLSIENDRLKERIKELERMLGALKNASILGVRSLAPPCDMPGCVHNNPQP